MKTPQFVVAGHVVRDAVADGYRLGGTVTFAAVQAYRLGLSVGIVTRCADDVQVQRALGFADIVCNDSSMTTTFENRYAGGERTQRVLQRAQPMHDDDVPAEWRAAPIALIGPVLGEVGASFAQVFGRRTLVGVSAQGWLRSLDGAGSVMRSAWEGEAFWRECDVLFVSDEDLDGRVSELELWARDVPVVAMTQSRRGARVFAAGAWKQMEAFPETEVDPTGAGDTFATAFLIRLHETGDVAEAARFGGAAASLSVGGVAFEAIPTRTEIEARLREHPEIRLR